MPLSRVHLNIASPLLIQYFPEISSISAGFDILYRGEVVLALLGMENQSLRTTQKRANDNLVYAGTRQTTTGGTREQDQQPSTLSGIRHGQRL
jgi:hypothetical protein